MGEIDPAENLAPVPSNGQTSPALAGRDADAMRVGCGDSVLAPSVTRHLPLLLLYGILGAVVTTGPAPHAQSGPLVGSFKAADDAPDRLRALVADVRRLEDAGTVRVTDATADAMLAGHTHERLQQYHLGLPVVGGTVARQIALGVVTSVSGQIYRTDIERTAPALTPDAVNSRLRARGLDLLTTPALKFLGMDDGGVRLVYETGVSSDGLNLRRLYVDADTAAELLSLPLVKDQGAVGEGNGVFGDRKKVATRLLGGAYFAEDLLRPPQLSTVDARSNRNRLVSVLNGAPLAQADIAVDTDNVWTDPVAVDAHTYLGWTYDFLFKRMGVRGLDNRNAPMFGGINAYSPQQCVTPLPDGDFGALCVNAFWAGPPAGPDQRGMMVFGNGIPGNFFLSNTGQTVAPLAGALDVVAHELTHGVTDYTSGLEYRDESGALNESFSDIVGVSAEAYFQTRGSATMQADWLIAEDVFRPLRAGSRAGLRSFESPTVFGHPDHYSLRYVGPDDSGGVHINSGISNHAFYLAVEGGTHRLSARVVTGVGFANREQIERVFFRAFTQMLPTRATFSQARAATLQSARDLYGAVPAVERAIADAWTAVGVQ